MRCITGGFSLCNYSFGEILAVREKRTPAAQETVHARTMPDHRPAPESAEKRKLAREADI